VVNFEVIGDVRFMLILMDRLAINAFLNVLRKRQSKYLKAIKWLNIRIATLKARKARMCERMRNIVSENG
jgi:hypothetical protein